MKTITTIINDIEEDKELVFPVLMQNRDTGQVWKFEGKYNAICVYAPVVIDSNVHAGETYCFNTACTVKSTWKKFKGKIVTTISN